MFYPDSIIIYPDSTIISGTLNQDDLLEAFSDELLRLRLGFKNDLILEAEDAAYNDDVDHDAKHEIITDLVKCLDTAASEVGCYFGTHPDDGADFGYWRYTE